MENSSSCRCSNRSCFNCLLCMMKNVICSKWKFVFKRKCNLCCIAFALLIYSINKIWLINATSGIAEVFCKSFLNDLVSQLFFLGFANITFLWAGFELDSYLKCLIVGMAGGILWEYFAPLINEKSTTDPLDLICYLAGISIYYLILRTEISYTKKCYRSPHRNEWVTITQL